MNKKIRIICMLTFCFLVFQTLPAFAKDLNGPKSDPETYKQLLSEQDDKNLANNSPDQELGKKSANNLLDSININSHLGSSSFYEREPNNSAYYADGIQLDQGVYGTITDVYYDLDYYKLTVTNPGELTVLGQMGDSSRTENSYFSMVLLDSNENAIQHSSLATDGNNYAQKIDVQNLQSGIYYIVALQTYESNNYVGESYALMASMETSSNIDLVPYKPSGWGDKLMVTKNPGQLYSDTSLTPNDELYISHAYINNGSASTPNTTIQTKLYVDNIEIKTLSYQGTIEPGYFIYAKDKSIGKLSAGTHIVKMVIDANDAINETNENNNEYSVTVNIGSNIIHPTSISLNKSTTTLAKDATEQLTATILPTNATKDVTWTSSNPSAAIVDSTGLVTAINPGQTTITVSTTDGNKTASCDVTVTDSTKTLKTLSADPTSLNLTIGDIEYITLTATYADGSTEDVTDLATWTSSKPSVASIDTNDCAGEVTALENGYTTITARYGGKAATIKITVQDDVTSEFVDIIVQPSIVSVARGKTQAVKIYGVNDDDSKVDITKDVTLESFDEGIATVTGSLIKGVCEGDTTVSGSYGEWPIDIEVYVTPPLKKLTLDPISLSLSEDDQSDPISLVATFIDGSEEDVTESATWTSSKPSVATVDIEDGNVMVNGVSKGSTTINGLYVGKKVTLKVKVTSLLVDLLVPETISIVKGKPQTVKIYAVYEDGSKEDVTKLSELESDNDGIAKVTGSTIKGIDIGETVVTGTYNDLPIEFTVIVTPPLKSLSVDATTLDLTLDQSEYLTLTAIYTDGSEEDVSGVATWTSSKPNIASIDVDAEGCTAMVTGEKKGSATITGSYGGKKVTVKVNVTE